MLILLFAISPVTLAIMPGADGSSTKTSITPRLNCFVIPFSDAPAIFRFLKTLLISESFSISFTTSLTVLLSTFNAFAIFEKGISIFSQ